MLLINLFTQGRPNSRHELTRVPAAREKAQLALYAYEGGVARNLGELLARSLRQTMREAAGLHNLNSDHTMGTLFLISKLTDVLEKNPDLLKASGLKPEEMEEARGNAELYNTLTNGTKARKDLLEHATGKKTLSQEELSQAGKDALFANIVIRKLGVAYKQQSAEIEGTEGYKKNLKDMEEGYGYTDVKAQAAEAEQQNRHAAAKALREKADEMQRLAETAKSRILLQEFTRPGYALNKALLKKDWVEAEKNRLAEAAGIDKIISGNNKGIIEAFVSNTELAKLSKDLDIGAKQAQPENALQLQNPKVENPQIQQPQNSAHML